MKVAFFCDMPLEHFLNWKDGLWAALELLRNKYGWTIDVFNLQETPDERINGDYDVGLFWGSLANVLFETRFFNKQALLFGGGPTYTPAIHNFDLIFAESQVDYLDFKRFGKKVIQAFGTNTKLFRPMPEQPKIYEYVYPAAFAKWKHHEKFTKYVINHGETINFEYELPSLAFGYMQPKGWEKECYEVCQKSGIAVMPQIPYEAVPYVLNASQHVYVAADQTGGCQRSVLEAKACGVDVVIDSDSPKLKELEKLTRKEILEKWSEESYALKIKNGIEDLLNESR